MDVFHYWIELTTCKWIQERYRGNIVRQREGLWSIHWHSRRRCYVYSKLEIPKKNVKNSPFLFVKGTTPLNVSQNYVARYAPMPSSWYLLAKSLLWFFSESPKDACANSQFRRYEYSCKDFVQERANTNSIPSKAKDISKQKPRSYHGQSRYPSPSAKDTALANRAKQDKKRIKRLLLCRCTHMYIQGKITQKRAQMIRSDDIVAFLAFCFLYKLFAPHKIEKSMGPCKICLFGEQWVMFQPNNFSNLSHTLCWEIILSCIRIRKLSLRRQRRTRWNRRLKRNRSNWGVCQCCCTCLPLLVSFILVYIQNFLILPYIEVHHKHSHRLECPIHDYIRFPFA